VTDEVAGLLTPVLGLHSNAVDIDKERTMKLQVGIWIDRRKAIIVTVSDDELVRSVVESNVDKHVRYSGGTGSGSRGSRAGTGEDTRERRFEGQLSKYYDEVMEQVRDAESILIFGPGEAKQELKTVLERGGLGARIVGVETVDKMTDRQIEAKVRLAFAP
jgi:stalled ribosome rescue protein Dom34